MDTGTVALINAAMNGGIALVFAMILLREVRPAMEKLSETMSRIHVEQVAAGASQAKEIADGMRDVARAVAENTATIRVIGRLNGTNSGGVG